LTTLVRILPPIAVPYQSMSAYGHAYSAAPGSTVDAPSSHADVLTSNSWIRAGRSSTTATRPTDQRVGEMIVDTTLGAVVIWDGATWRNPATGAAV
jgi:hypothetical protein